MPSLKDLKAMIRMNLIHNNSITTKDISLAEKVYGPDVGTRKEKSTRQHPNHVTDISIELPDELMDIQKEVTVLLDGMEINSVKFITTIAHDLYYCMAQYISDSVKSQYTRVLDELYGIYKKGGFTLVEIHCNNEFRPVMQDWTLSKNPVIQVNYANPQDHVPQAERNNRVIQERVQECFITCPTTICHKLLLNISEWKRHANLIISLLAMVFQNIIVLK